MNNKVRLAAVAAFLCMAQAAEAKKFALFNTGDELFEVGPFPTALSQKYEELGSLAAGYKCDHFGVFWADVWTWNCTRVAVTADDTYMDLPADVEAALASDPAYGLSHAKRSFWNHYGFWTVLGALVVVPLIRKKMSA